MKSTVITLVLSQSDLKREAMVRAGLSPQALGMRKGTRVERSKKSLLKCGHVKHKSKDWA